MEIRVITYNIDGLPSQVDLNYLPWLLRPVAWIYKLIKGTTVITVNDNPNRKEDTEEISRRLFMTNADIIGVQEDFNYHAELMKFLDGYRSGTSIGGIDLKHILSTVKWLPYPRLKADGLNVIVNCRTRHRITFLQGDIVHWEKSCGYFSHANDKLTMKGFRFYELLLDCKVRLDVYVLHMDADYYNEETCPDVSGDIEARKAELEQLTKYILANNKGNPAIVMGDTNLWTMWDSGLLQSHLIKPLEESGYLNVRQPIACFGTIDKVLYLNNARSAYDITLTKCYFDESFNKDGRLSDHTPLVAEFDIKEKGEIAYDKD